MKEILWVLTEALVIKKKSVVLILVKQTQNFALVYIIMLIMAICLLICVPKETKYINIKALNMIGNQDEVKAMAEHILCDYKCKFNNATCNSNQKWNNKTCQCESKNYHTCEKIVAGTLVHAFVRIVCI